jgi:hypothetical protein
MKKRVLLTLSLLFCAFLSTAQNTWRLVEDSDLEKVFYFNVFNVNDRIYTFASTIAPNETITHVKTNLIQLNYDGTMVVDSLFGSSEYTFVQMSNARASYKDNKFYLLGEHRYPNTPNFEPLGINILDTNYNIIAQRFLPLNSQERNEYIANVLPETDSVYSISNSLSLGSGANMTFRGIRMQQLNLSGDTLQQIDIPASPNLNANVLIPSQIHKSDNHYIVVATQVQETGWSNPPSN